MTNSPVLDFIVSEGPTIESATQQSTEKNVMLNIVD
jgi:hypothetical protein